MHIFIVTRIINVVSPVRLNIIIESYGVDDPGFDMKRSPFRINGIETGHASHGLNVVVISSTNGCTLGIGNFYMFHSLSNPYTALMSFTSRYPDGSIVCIAITGTVNFWFAYEVKTYLASLGSVGALYIHGGSSLAMLTVKGLPKPAWFKEKYAIRGIGPSILVASLQI